MVDFFSFQRVPVPLFIGVVRGGGKGGHVPPDMGQTKNFHQFLGMILIKIQNFFRLRCLSAPQVFKFLVSVSKFNQKNENLNFFSNIFFFLVNFVFFGQKKVKN